MTTRRANDSTAPACWPRRGEGRSRPIGEYGVLSTEYGVLIPSTEYRVPSTEYRVRNTWYRSRVLGTEYLVLSTLTCGECSVPALRALRAGLPFFGCAEAGMHRG